MDLERRISNSDGKLRQYFGGIVCVWLHELGIEARMMLEDLN